MSERARAFGTCLLTLVMTLAMSALASQQGRPPRGTKVAVVAIHDSRLLTLCPEPGKHITTDATWTPGMGPMATLVPSPYPDSQVIRLHLPDLVSRGAMVLPTPASPAGTTAASAVPVLERLARDLGVRGRIEEEFRRRKTYTVVDSTADADIIFLVESTYMPMAGSQKQLPPPASGRPRESGRRPEDIFGDAQSEWSKRWVGDRQPGSYDLPEGWGRPDPPPNKPGSVVGVFTYGGDRFAGWRQSSLAIAVPAGVYRQHVGDGTALTAARTWQGATTEELPRGGPMTAASPEALVDQFHGKRVTWLDFLPVCAATAGTIVPIVESASRAGGGRTVQTPDEEPPARDAGSARFRSNVTLVAVPITVTDTDGRNVVDLQSSAVHVFEDGLEQKIDRLELGSAPARVALLLDTSSGMKTVSEGIRGAALSMVNALRPADEAMVISFDNRVRVLFEFTSDRTALQRAVDGLRPRGQTRLYDALALTIVDRLNPVEGRKAIVAFTDGVDTGSQLTDATGAIAAADSSDVGVYVVRYDTSDAPAAPSVSVAAAGQRWSLVSPEDRQKGPAAQSAADEFLGRLANSSGGRMFVAQANANPREILGQISEELSHQYILYYYPTNDKLDGSYREIRVTVDKPGSTIRARTGYRAAAIRAGR